MVRSVKVQPESESHCWCAHAIFVPTFFPFLLISQPLFIYIPLSCSSRGVIKPWKREWEEGGFGGGGPTVPQWWKWVFPEPLLTYLLTHNSRFKYPWNTLRWLVWSDSDKNRRGLHGFKFLMKLQLRHQKREKWARGLCEQQPGSNNTRLRWGNAWKVNSAPWALILGVCHGARPCRKYEEEMRLKMAIKDSYISHVPAASLQS